jgi:hypothetical protein
MNRRVPALALFFVLVGGAFYLQAADGPAASGIPYVGRVENAGIPLNDPGIPMTFTLYDAATGGTQLHDESATVAVQGGAFAHVIGAGGLDDAEAIYRSSELWLAISVDGTALNGRQRLYAATQAQRADRAHTLDVTGSITTGGDIIVSAPFAMTTADDVGVVLGELNDGTNDEPGDVSLRVGAGGTAKVTGPLEVTGTISASEHVAGKWRRFNDGVITCPVGSPGIVNWPGEVYASDGLTRVDGNQVIEVAEAGFYRVEASVLVRSLNDNSSSDLSLETRPNDVGAFVGQVTSRVHGQDGDATHVISTTVQLPAGGGLRFVCQGANQHQVYGGGSPTFTVLTITKVP